MLPVLWHHPIRCFGITHLDENGWANLTQTLAGHRDQPEKCVVVVTVDTTGLGKGDAMLATSTAVAACSHVLAMGTLAKSQTFHTACPHVTQAELRALEATHSCSWRANDQIVRAPFWMARTTA